MLLSASVLLPAAHAGTDTPSTTPQTVLRQMAEAPRTSPATVEQRAAALGSLAMIPQDAEFFLSIPNMPGSAQRLSQSLWARTAYPDLPELHLVKQLLVGKEYPRSIVIAGGAGSAKALARLMPILGRMEIADRREKRLHIPQPPAYGSENMTDEQIMAAWQQYDQERHRQTHPYRAPILKDLYSAPLPPITLIAELPVRQMEKIPAIMQEIQQLCNDREHAGWFNLFGEFHEGQYDGLHWQGVRIDGGKIYGSMQRTAILYASDEAYARWLKEMEPLLSGRECYILAATHGGKLIVSICTDPAREIHLAKTPQESILATDKTAFADARLPLHPDMLFHIDQGFFEHLAREIDEQMAREKKIQPRFYTASILEFCQACRTLIQPAPVNGIIWQDKGIHAELAYGRDRSIDPSSILKIASIADRPTTILYAEGASSREGIGAFMPHAAEIARALADGLELTDASFRKIGRGFSAILDGWQGDAAFVMDNQGHLPEELAGTMSKLHIPRIAFYADVRNRQDIEQGWQTVVHELETMDADDFLSDELIPYWRSNGTDIFLTDLTDKNLVVSASGELNNQILAAVGKTSGDIRGGAFVLRFAPIKEMIDRNIPIFAEQGDPIPDQIMQSIENVSQAFDGIYGTATPQNDRTKLHLYIRAK